MRSKVEKRVRWFHVIRLVLWTAQIPIALTTDLKKSVAYLVFLSIAALVESAGTDVYQAFRDRDSDDDS